MYTLATASTTHKHTGCYPVDNIHPSGDALVTSNPKSCRQLLPHALSVTLLSFFTCQFFYSLSLLQGPWIFRIIHLNLFVCFIIYNLPKFKIATNLKLVCIAQIWIAKFLPVPSLILFITLVTFSLLTYVHEVVCFLMINNKKLGQRELLTCDEHFERICFTRGLGFFLSMSSLQVLSNSYPNSSKIVSDYLAHISFCVLAWCHLFLTYIFVYLNKAKFDCLTFLVLRYFDIR